MTSLSKIKSRDELVLRECLNTFLSWYIKNAEKIETIAEIMIESDEDVVNLVLNAGLLKMEEAAVIMKEAEVMEDA